MELSRLKFGEFELDMPACELRRGTRSIQLERIPMDLLMLLVERRGQVVTRAEIVERLWGKNVFLDADTSINTAINKLRRALHDNPERPAFIKTITGKGYRFIAPVAVIPAAQSVTSPSAPAPGGRVMLAVLPFENMSRDPEQEYFGDGLTEETISHLGRIWIPRAWA
jgi:DNA-binding winged helix-turn-helix (wHTH) protein